MNDINRRCFIMLYQTAYRKGVNAALLELVLVSLEAGGDEVDERESPLRACNPPTTPPIIAAAIRSASSRRKSSQNRFRFKPSIFRSGGTGGGAVKTSFGVIVLVGRFFDGTSGEIGLKPVEGSELGEVGLVSGSNAG